MFYDILGFLTPTNKERNAPHMCNFIEQADKVSNNEFDHLTRLLNSECPLTWGSKSNTYEIRVDVGIINHVEVTGKNADVNDLGLIQCQAHHDIVQFHIKSMFTCRAYQNHFVQRRG